jgi:hypothetical protein
MQAGTGELCTAPLDVCELQDKNAVLENRVQELESCVRILKAISVSPKDDKAYQAEWRKQWDKETLRVALEWRKGESSGPFRLIAETIIARIIEQRARITSGPLLTHSVECETAMKLLPKSITLGPSNLEMTVPAVTLAMLRGFAGLDKFGRWRPSIKAYGPRPTEEQLAEQRAAAWARYQPISAKAVSILNRWYTLPVVYFCVLVIRPLCLLLARIRDAIAKRKWRKIAEQNGIPWEY